MSIHERNNVIDHEVDISHRGAERQDGRKWHTCRSRYSWYPLETPVPFLSFGTVGQTGSALYRTEEEMENKHFEGVDSLLM